MCQANQNLILKDCLFILMNILPSNELAWFCKKEKVEVVCVVR